MDSPELIESVFDLDDMTMAKLEHICWAWNMSKEDVIRDLINDKYYEIEELE